MCLYSVHMNTKEQYKEYRNEVGKDAIKALLFFFVGLPCIVSAIVLLVMF